MRALLLTLRRHTSSGLYIPEIDGLRFVAIFSVYLYHLAGDILRHTPVITPHSSSVLFRLTQQLNVGVPLFFAISGMILGMPFARYWLLAGPKISLTRYLWRRVTRLEPPYMVALLLFFVLKLVGNRGGFGELLPHLGASVVYLHNAIYDMPSSINFVAWSLEVEIQFYLLAPLLALVFAIRRTFIRRAVISGAMIAFTLLARTHYMGSLTNLTLADNIQYFLAGLLLADLFLLIPPTIHHSHRWDAVSVVGWPILALMLVDYPSWSRLLLPAFILLLYVATFYGKISSTVFASVWVAAMGGMCYTIYLLHNYIVAAVGMVTERVGQNLSFELRFILQLLLISPFVLAVSIAYYRLIEQPCMHPDWPARLKRFLGERRKDNSAALSHIAGN